MPRIRNLKNPYPSDYPYPACAKAWDAGYEARADELKRQSQIRDLELAEALSQNARLGARLFQIEAEMISRSAKIAELEARLALESRRSLGTQIETAVRESEARLAAVKNQVSVALDIPVQNLTSASLKGSSDD